MIRRKMDKKRMEVRGKYGEKRAMKNTEKERERERDRKMRR